MKTIAIDSGHGLKTPGKQTPDGIKEWTLNDRVRDKIVAYLKDYDVKIIFPDNNEGNVDESLTARRTMYVNAKVDAASSIHHNALDGKWGQHTGIEVWVDKNATKEDLEFANLIYKKLVEYTGLKGRGIKKENFTVINQNKVPAALIEGGFMDSKIDYPVITSEKGQDAYARAVAEAYIEFLKLKKKNVSQQTNTANTTKTSNFKEYTVKITADVLNVRAGAGTNYKVNTTVKKGQVYTIVDEDNGWGKLKSGAGWISLKYTSKDTKTTTSSTKTTTSYYPACDKKHTSIVAALKSIGVDSSYENREKIARKNNVRDYKGTATQNNQLLSKLKAGRLKK